MCWALSQSLPSKRCHSLHACTMLCKSNIPRASKSVFKMSLSGGGDRRFDFCCRFFWLKGQVPFWWWRCSKCYFSVTFGATVFVLCALLNGSNGRLDLPAQKEEWSRQSKQIKVFSFRFNWIFFSLCSREFSGFLGAGSWYLFRTEIYRYCYDPYPSICHKKLLCCQHRN